MSLRERLLNRPRPSDAYPIRIDDDTQAREALEEAQSILRLLQIQGDVADVESVARAHAAVAEAEGDLKACYEPVILRALRPDDWEALIALHSPREGTEDDVWNAATFPRACLLACIESDLTEEELGQLWTEVLSKAEQVRLCNAAIRVNVRVPDASLPKGWTQTPD